MSRLSALAIGQRSVTLLLAGALFIAGVSAWGSLKQELLPDVDFPVITVIAPYPGVGASDVEKQVAEPIERSIQGQARLSDLRSTSANGIALVVAQFEFGTNVKDTLATIQDNVRSLGLPTGVSPTVSALNINASPVIIASIATTGGDSLEAAANIANTEILPAIQSLDGVGSADLTGALEQQLVVTLDPAKQAAAKVSTQQVIGILQANNVTIPSGTVSDNGTSIPVSTVGTLTSVDQISNLLVGANTTTTPPTPIFLKDIATVALAQVPTTGYARTNGNPALTLTVTKTSSGNTVQVAREVEQVLADAQAGHQGEISIVTVQDLSSFIVESQDGLLREGGLGALFAVLTIFLFLFSLRSTLVAAISIPLSVLTALVLMQVADVSLNVMTLGGLAVAVGRVVDDAIVVLENIYRHRALGEDKFTAVTRGPSEVARAITASTLTTVMVFLPIGFVGGLVSQLFLPFALTVTFALLASLVCALTVVPVLAYLFIGRVKPNVDVDGAPKNSLWVRAYTPLIRTALRSRKTRWAVLLISAALFFASLTLVSKLPTQFINTGSEKILGVTLIPPAGASSQQVLDKATQAEGIVMQNPDVEIVQTSVPGAGDTSFGTVFAALSGQPANSARMTVRFHPTVDLDSETATLTSTLAPIRADGFDFSVAQTAGFTNNNLTIVVSGPDVATVKTATDAVMSTVAGRTDLANLTSDLAQASPEIEVTVDPNKALAVGSTAAQIGTQVRALLTPTTVGNLALSPDGVATLIVQTDPNVASSVDALRAVLVGNLQQVPLSQVADVEQVDVQGSITRINGAPAAQISAEVTSKDTGTVSREVSKQVDDLVASGALPSGVTVTMTGITSQMNEAFSGLFTSMAVAILLVYVMMVIAFNSLVTPFIIMFSLPLATIGAFPALFLTGRAIGVSSLIGFLMLIGIVVTNAIVLLDLVERLRAEGMPMKEALIEGGRTRVRPILMTAFATILALIPLAAGFNQGSIIAAELGTVVIGGLFSSTFLTLLVVPVVYSLVEGGKSSLRQRFSRPTAPEPVVALTPAVAMAVPAAGTRVAPAIGHAIPDMPIVVEEPTPPALAAGGTLALPEGRKPGLIRRFLRWLLGR